MISLIHLINVVCYIWKFIRTRDLEFPKFVIMVLLIQNHIFTKEMYSLDIQPFVLSWYLSPTWTVVSKMHGSWTIYVVDVYLIHWEKSVFYEAI